MTDTRSSENIIVETVQKKANKYNSRGPFLESRGLLWKEKTIHVCVIFSQSNYSVKYYNQIDQDSTSRGLRRVWRKKSGNKTAANGLRDCGASLGDASGRSHKIK